MPTPLQNLRILVPPSRPELNPLLKVLEMKGATVVEWPRIWVAEPDDYAPMDAAIREAAGLHWLLFSGSECVRNFFRRLERLGADPAEIFGRRVAAIGHGALGALKERGVEVDVYPRRHVAADVVAALGQVESLAGKRFLLVRVAGAPASLPGALKRQGAEVVEVAGYRLAVEAAEAAGSLEPRPDLVAFANPAAVRVFLRGLEALRLKPGEFLAGVEVACVGPATTGEARARGLTVDIASGGSQAALVADLLKRYGQG